MKKKVKFDDDLSKNSSGLQNNNTIHADPNYEFGPSNYMSANTSEKLEISSNDSDAQILNLNKSLKRLE